MDESNIQVNVPQVSDHKELHKMYRDTIQSKATSTFIPFFSTFHLQIVSNTPSVVNTSRSSSIPVNVDEDDDDGLVSKV
jgi:hypothetical protein